MHASLLTSVAAGPPPLAVSLNTTNAGAQSTGQTPTTNTVTATASGGTAPYSYAWNRLSGSALVIAINPASASTAFKPSSAITGGQVITAVFELVVTDNVGATIHSAQVNVYIERDVSGGGGGLQ
jgi:hypothetical protein